MLPVELYRGDEAPRSDHSGGVLSPKHETGVAWFQDRIAGAPGLPKPQQLAAVG